MVLKGDVDTVQLTAAVPRSFVNDSLDRILRGSDTYKVSLTTARLWDIRDVSLLPLNMQSAT